MCSFPAGQATWSSDTLTCVEQLGKRISENTGDNQETAYLLQRLSIAIQRCNAIRFSGSFEGHNS